MGYVTAWAQRWGGAWALGPVGGGSSALGLHGGVTGGLTCSGKGGLWGRYGGMSGVGGVGGSGHKSRLGLQCTCANSQRWWAVGQILWERVYVPTELRRCAGLSEGWSSLLAGQCNGPALAFGLAASNAFY